MFELCTNDDDLILYNVLVSLSSYIISLSEKLVRLVSVCSVT